MGDQVDLIKDGTPISVPVEQAGSLVEAGWKPESDEAQLARNAQEARAASAPNALVAGSLGIARGLTLGLSDVAGRAIGGQTYADFANSAAEAHPYVTGAGNIAGAIAPALLGDEAGLANLTPAGFTSQIGSKIASGVDSRLLGTALAGATEGAAQNAGSYISDVALGNRDLSAEGFLGAMGKGALYGGVAGGALSVASNGLIAARKLFPLEEQTVEGAARAKLAAQQAIGDSVNTSTQLEQTGQQAVTQTDRETQQFLTDLDQERGVALDRAAQARNAEEQVVASPTADATAPTGPSRVALRSQIRSEIQTGQVPGEVGPFTDEGLDLATERELARRTGVEPPKDAGTLMRAWRERYPQGAVDYDAATAAARKQRLSDWARDFTAETPEDATVKAYFSEPQDPIGMPRNLTDVPKAVQEVARKAAADASHEAYVAETANATNVSKTGAEQMARATYAGRRAAARAMDDVYVAYKAGQPIVDIRAAVSQKLTNEIREVAESRADMLKELASQPEMADQLMSQLQGTKAAVDQGAALGDVSRMSLGERILQGVQKPIDPDQAVATALGKSQDVNEDIARIAPKVTRYEAANAKLTESLGEKASPDAIAHAQAFRAAQDHAANMNARVTAQATDTIDAATRGVPTEAQPGGNSIFKGLAKRVSKLGELAEVLHGFGVAHIGLHAIPVIGPALSAILKAKVLAKLVGKQGGSFAATAEGTIAAKAATTQNRIRAAVGKMIGNTGEKLADAAPEIGAATALGFKLFDDGKKRSTPYSSVPAEGDLTEMYHARLDELTAAMQPGAVEQAVRARINTSDPTIVDALIKSEQTKLGYLYNLAPKPEIPALPGQSPWSPSKVAMLSFGKILAAAHDPAAIFERVAKGGVAHPDEIDCVQNCYPQLFATAQTKLVDELAKMPKALPYARRIAISSLLSMPVDPTMRPEHIAFLQSGMPQPRMPAPSTPPSPTLSSSISLGRDTLTRLDR